MKATKRHAQAVVAQLDDVATALEERGARALAADLDRVACELDDSDLEERRKNLPPISDADEDAS